MNESSPDGFDPRRRAPYRMDMPFEQDSFLIDDPEQDDPLKLDVRAVWSAIYRHRILIAVVVLLSLGVGLAVTMLSTPIYQASASVQIEQQAARVLNTDDIQPEPGRNEDRFLQTQVDILRSRSLAERTAQTLDFFGNNRFLIAMGQRVPADATMAPGAQDGLRRQVVSLLQGNLTIELPRESRVVQIAFESPDPALAARVANGYAENFIVSNLDRKYEASSYARNFLEKQLAEAKERLERSERAAIAYARSAQLIDASGGTAATAGGSSGPRSLVTASLVQLNDALSEAVSARVAAQQRWQQAQSTPIMSLPEVQANGTIQGLIAQRSQAQAAYQEELQRRKEDFPTMRQAAARIDELGQQIARLAQEARLSLRDRYQVAARQEQALRGQLAQLKGETLAEQDRSVDYNILRREVDTNRTLYDGLLQRYKEVSAASGVASNNVSIVDRAMVPSNPIYPKPVLNLAIAGLGGLALALLMIFARETFDDAIRLPEDVDKKLGVPFLGAIPRLETTETPKDAFADQRSAFAEAYYALRSTLEFASAGGLPRSLLCTSSVEAEGKSTTSVSLARSFARIGRRVLLVDADLRNPSLHRTMERPNEVGFSNLLTRQLDHAQIVQETETPNLSFIACGPLPPNPGELLASAQLRSVVEGLTELYDLVLFDGPPVMGLADSPLISSVCGGTIFVVEASRARRGQAKVALRRLKSSHAHLLGVVLTKFDARAIGYGYNYSYSYRYNYGRNQQEEKSLFRFFK